MHPISVVILTKNEELTIKRAIASVKPFADEVLLVDSQSTDRTQEFAEAAGAKFYIQPWLGWVEQRNKGATLASHDWVFFMDSDEIVTEELATSIRQAMAGDPDPGTGFVIERRDEFLGRMTFNTRRKSKRSGFVRLYNRSLSSWRIEMLIHEETRCPGPLVKLAGSLIHWRNYTIADQVDTYNRYSELEAKEILAGNKANLSIRVIFKPVLRFLWVYIKCGHWRLGMRGFIWSVMNAVSEFLRLAKAWEGCHARRTLDPPESIYRQADRSTASVLAVK